MRYLLESFYQKLNIFGSHMDPTASQANSANVGPFGTTRGLQGEKAEKAIKVPVTNYSLTVIDPIPLLPAFILCNAFKHWQAHQT
jgi:hypothetical protein